VVDPAYLGVELTTPEEGGGAKVARVFEDTPAAKAGLKEGDRIVAVNDEEAADPEDLSSLVGRLTAGAEAELLIARDGQEQTITVTLGRRETPAPQKPLSGWKVDLVVPQEYRLHVLPAPGKAGISHDYVKALEKALGELLKKQPGSVRVKPPDPRQPPLAIPAPTAPQAPAPLALRVQRSDVDRRLNDLADEVKALRSDVKRLGEQLKAVAEKLDE
ncbi:MAG: PDZ domain-containing protein, partial [Planctomycetes bacterium]|nr:PDZ domain-containing protein [Planctomycetota bacterium]